MQLETDVSCEGDVVLLVSRAGRALLGADVPEEERGRIVTVCAELARNIVKYAVRGVVRLHVLPAAGGRVVVVEAVDRGPGIDDVDAALRDHFSSGGTLGLGLPGVRRLMDSLRIVSRAGLGTEIRAERFLRARQARS